MSYNLKFILTDKNGENPKPFGQIGAAAIPENGAVLKLLFIAGQEAKFFEVIKKNYEYFNGMTIIEVVVKEIIKKEK